MPGVLQVELAAAGIEDGERGDHGGEDPGEQSGHLDDRRPAEAVLGAQRLGRGQPGEDDHENDAGVLHRVGQRQRPRRQQHGHDSCEKEEVVLSGDADRHLMLDGDPVEVARPGEVLGAEDRRVDDVEEDQQDGVREQPGTPEPQRPGERDAAEEAEEQGRIPHGREQAARVGDDEDEEHEHVRLAPAHRIRAQQRPDEEHRRARGADDGSEDGADAEKHRVQAGSAGEGPADHDAPGDDEQCAEQDDERHVLAGGVHHGGRIERRRPDRHRGTKDEAEERLVVVVLPDPASYERQDGDTDQHDDERRDAPERELVSQLQGGRGVQDGHPINLGKSRSPVKAHFSWAPLDHRAGLAAAAAVLVLTGSR